MSPHQASSAPGGHRAHGAVLTAAQDGVALSRLLFDLEARLADLALRQTLQYQQQFGALAHALLRLYAGPFIEHRQAQEMQDLGRRYLELALIGQGALVRTMFGQVALRSDPKSGRPVPERRISAEVISFPERRVANR